MAAVHHPPTHTIQRHGSRRLEPIFLAPIDPIYEDLATIIADKEYGMELGQYAAKQLVSEVRAYLMAGTEPLEHASKD